MADVKTEKKFASLETAKKINDDVASLKEDLGDFQAPLIDKIIIKSHNLIEELQNGAVISSNGSYIPASENENFKNFWSSAFIEVDSLSNYILSENGTPIGVSTSALYDSDKRYISGDVFNLSTVSIPENVKYIRFSIQRDSKPLSVQFEKGSTPSEYIKYGDYKLILNVDSIAYKINSEIKELVECNNLYGAYIKNDFHKELNSFHGYATKVYDVTGIDFVYLTGNITAWTNAYTLLDKNKKIMQYKQVSSDTTFSNEVVDVKNASFIAVSSYNTNFWSSNRIKIAANITIKSRWKNKKIVWFGTSIPAAGYKGSENDYGYPYIVGRYLDAVVYNEAVGSSPLHGRQLARVSATNPYGFMASFEPASRALCNTIEQMQWIANWIDYKLNGGTYKNNEEWDENIFTNGLPKSWTDSDTNDLLSFSYENKVNKYLTDENFPDLFVIDHGYNDDINWSDEQGYYDRDFSIYGRHNPFTFRGAANFIIDQILSFNPHAKIIMIGCYDKSLNTKSKVHTYQEIIADDNQIPLLKLWEMTGLTQTVLSLKGKWVDGLWQETSSIQEYTVMNANLPDTIHPHSDKSGRMLRVLADIITPFVESN